MEEHWKEIDGVRSEMTSEEIQKQVEAERQAKKAYWSQDYNTLVNNEIRKRYSLSEELALSRQRLEKPDEFKRYFDYCEECKRRVKEVSNVGTKN